MRVSACWSALRNLPSPRCHPPAYLFLRPCGFEAVEPGIGVSEVDAGAALSYMDGTRCGKRMGRTGRSRGSQPHFQQKWVLGKGSTVNAGDLKMHIGEGMCPRGRSPPSFRPAPASWRAS